jgi:hypothetical protein
MLCVIKIIPHSKLTQRRSAIESGLAGKFYRLYQGRRYIRPFGDPEVSLIRPFGDPEVSLHIDKTNRMKKLAYVCLPLAPSRC